MSRPTDDQIRAWFGPATAERIIASNATVPDRLAAMRERLERDKAEEES